MHCECSLGFAFEIVRTISAELPEASAPLLFWLLGAGSGTMDSPALLPLLWFGSSGTVVKLHLPILFLSYPFSATAGPCCFC